MKILEVSITFLYITPYYIIFIYILMYRVGLRLVKYRTQKMYKKYAQCDNKIELIIAPNLVLYKQIKYNKNSYIVFEKYKQTKLENKIKMYNKMHLYISTLFKRNYKTITYNYACSHSCIPLLHALLGFCHGYPLNDFTYLPLYCEELNLCLCLMNLDDSSLSNLLKFLFLFLL